jgi:hypothetical protein
LSISETHRKYTFSFGSVSGLATTKAPPQVSQSPPWTCCSLVALSYRDKQFSYKEGLIVYFLDLNLKFELKYIELYSTKHWTKISWVCVDMLEIYDQCISL